MKGDYELHRLIESLKRVIKQRKVTYRELATYLQISVPSVKRMMSKGEFSLSRLFKICEFLGITFTDLAELCSRQEGEEYHFTPEVEEYFAKYPHYLAYFFALVDGLTPSTIEKKFHLTSQCTRLYLHRLEQFYLIKVSREDQVKILATGAICWKDDGKLGQVFSKRMVKAFAERAIKNVSSPGPLYLDLNGWHLTSENYHELKNDLVVLANKFRILSNYNRKFISKTDLENYSFMVVTDLWAENVFSNVMKITK